MPAPDESARPDPVTAGTAGPEARASDDAAGAADAAAAGAADAAAPPSGPAAPVPDADRVELIDALRGVAIFGILLVNAMFFAHPMTVDMGPHIPGYTALDRAASAFVDAVATGKFYALFSLLFGLGVIVQTERADGRGAKSGWLYARRLLVLACIGAIHGALIWSGDILTTYALIGFVLLPFRRRKARTVGIWACATYGLVTLVVMAFALATMLGATEAVEGAVERLAKAQPLYELYAGGGYLDITAHRAAEFAKGLVRSLIVSPLFLGMFLLGVYIAKRRLLHDVAENARTLRRLAIAGAIVGVPTGVLFALIEPNGLDLQALEAWRPAGMASYMLGGPVLCLGYVGGLALLYQRPAWRRRLAYLAPVGRMALSNYLTHSVVFTLLSYGYGFGLFGRIRPAAGLALTVAMVAAQVVISRWWLARFRFGPVEWLWRSLTYGARQPMRRRPAASLAPARPA